MGGHVGLQSIVPQGSSSLTSSPAIHLDRASKCVVCFIIRPSSNEVWVQHAIAKSPGPAGLLSTFLWIDVLISMLQ